MVHVVSPDSAIWGGLSPLKLLRSALLITLVLFAWLIIALILVILVVAAQIVIMAQFKLIIVIH